jgi:hypothetical protein
MRGLTVRLITGAVSSATTAGADETVAASTIARASEIERTVMRRATE